MVVIKRVDCIMLSPDLINSHSQVSDPGPEGPLVVFNIPPIAIRSYGD